MNFLIPSVASQYLECFFVSHSLILSLPTDGETGIASFGTVERCHVSFAVGKRTNQQLQIGILVKKKLEILVKGVMFV
jgi:hypothetical protein